MLLAAMMLAADVVGGIGKTVATAASHGPDILVDSAKQDDGIVAQVSRHVGRQMVNGAIDTISDPKTHQAIGNTVVGSTIAVGMSVKDRVIALASKKEL